MMLARLKRYNGKTHVLRSYTVFGIKFLESKGWYRVDDDVAAYLRNVKQIQEGPDAEYSAPAFDVCTEEEAVELDEREIKLEERRKAQQANIAQRRTVTDAQARRAGRGDLTTADLPTQPRPKRSPSFDEQPETLPEDGEDMAPPRATAPALDTAAFEDEEALDEQPVTAEMPQAEAPAAAQETAPKPTATGRRRR